MKKVIILALSICFLSFSATITPTISYGAQAYSLKKPSYSKVIFKAEDMDCKNCVKKVEENISFLKGVKNLKVTLETHLIEVTYDSKKIDIETLCKEISSLGYNPEIVE